MEVRELCRQIEQEYRGKGEGDVIALYGQFEDPNALYGGWEDMPVIFLAASHADAAAVELLLARGADAGARREGNGATALHALAEGPQNLRAYPAGADPERTAALLLEAGASALRKDADGRAAIHLAARNACHGMIAALVRAGKKLDLTDLDGNTALHIAVISACHAADSFYKYTLPKYEQAVAEPVPENETMRKVHASRLESVLDQHGREKARCDDFFHTVRLLLEGGLDPEQKNKERKTARELAFECADLRVPALLNGEEPEAAEDDEQAALRLRARGMSPMQAVLARNPDALAAVLALGADPDEPCDERGPSGLPAGVTPLGAACALLDMLCIAALLEGGADPGCRDSSGRIAAAYCFTVTASVNTSHNTFQNRVVEQMLEGMKAKGLDLDASADDAGNTLLLLACQRLDAATGYNNDTLPGRFLQVLLRLGADPNPANYAGVTPLMPVCAGRGGHIEDALLSLLEAGAAVEARDGEGNGTLHWAARNPNHALSRTLAELLCEFGDPDAQAVNNAGQTALALAADAGNELLVSFLLQRQ